MPAIEDDTASGAAGRPKHRACDECRARKMACSKEPDGCLRCKRERITCHYSPQKPMGRPRKRLHSDVVGEENNTQVVVHSKDVSTEAAPAVDHFFLDPNTPNLHFLELLGPAVCSETGSNTNGSSLDEPKPAWHFDHTVKQPIQPSISPHMLNSRGEAVQLVNSSSVDSTPSLSSSLSNSPPGGSPPGPQAVNQPFSFPNRPCGCTASLYLALDSIQSLPQETGAAMRVVRDAAKAAHATTQCPSCSPPDITDPNVHPPIQAFQTMMMVGALLPVLANAYNQILVMVDEETGAAVRERRQMTFSLEKYGGLWGRMAANCNDANRMNSTMDPMLWRLLVRALLKLDVYGVQHDSSFAINVPAVPFAQIGLKDIISMMETRSRLRHEAMDKAIASGQMRACDIKGHAILPPGEKHNCQKIIEIARNAIEQLVIA